MAVAVALTLFTGAYAQPTGALTEENRAKIDEIEDTLAVLAFTFLNDSIAENRFAACRSFIPALVRALKVESSFDYSFERLPNVSVQYPADSTFRIFSWQLYVDENDYRYFGAIQMNDPSLRLVPLVDRSFAVEYPEEAVLSPEQWYGAVYYNLRQVDSPQGRYYLLFGFDGYDFFRKRKLLDVLSFDASGKPAFGAPVFVDSTGVSPKKRLVLEYSAAASIRLNYDEALDMIIFDHLIETTGQYGEGAVNLPDGSYEGYRIENGRLTYVSNVWTQVQDEAPRPMPILDGPKKDLFGNR
jgi:hypothetical protein